MNDRINSANSRPPSAPMPTSRTGSAPTDSPNIDQAAADFASLLGTDPPKTETKETKYRDDSPADSERTGESDRPRTEHERVEERKHDRGDDDGGGSESDSRDSSGEGAVEVMSLGDAILQAFSSKEISGAAAIDAPQPAGMASLDQIVQQVADRILVSPPGAGQAEVRIMLKDSVLPGTEVRITQVGGQLQINLVTDSAKSLDVLQQNQAFLQQRLTEKVSQHDVVVNVEFSGDSQPDRDGRSRNQRDIYEESKE